VTHTMVARLSSRAWEKNEQAQSTCTFSGETGCLDAAVGPCIVYGSMLTFSTVCEHLEECAACRDDSIVRADRTRCPEDSMILSVGRGILRLCARESQLIGHSDGAITGTTPNAQFDEDSVSFMQRWSRAANASPPRF
jgi:hypothetical protein